MIIDLELAKQHLRELTDDNDDIIFRMIDEGRVIVLDYLKVAVDVYEDESGNHDVPILVGAAMLRVIQNLYDRPEEDPLDNGVRSILHRSRSPAMA